MSDVERNPLLHALCLADPVWAERYDGWDELGHGGSATVVRTRSRASDDWVALKIFTRLDAEGRGRFQQEVRHNQLLASPFVVRTYSPFLRAGLGWIEMEWVDGPDLRHEIERRAAAGQPFAPPQARRLGAALARALVAAHAAGVVHRDVKPANVLLPRSGRPLAKLGDFGIARVPGAARLTATGLIAGTPQFVAPEVVAGRPADARSDVYSLALTLFLLLSGRLPYDLRAEDAPAGWLEAHARGRPLRLREVAPEADAALDELLARALSKDPAERPSAAEVAAALADPADPLIDARATGAPLADSLAYRAQVTDVAGRDQAPPPTEGHAGTQTLRTARRRWLMGAAAAGVAAAWLLWTRGVSAPVTRPARMAESATPRAQPPAQPDLARSPSPSFLSVAPAPAPEPAAGLTVALEGPPQALLLVLANDGRAPCPPFDVDLVADDGRVSKARSAQDLLPGDELALALDALHPAPDARARFVRVDLTFDDGRRARLPLARR